MVKLHTIKLETGTKNDLLEKTSLVLWYSTDSPARSRFYNAARDSLCALVVALSEKASTIQYGYRKCTHARVFSRTLAHGNSKN